MIPHGEILALRGEWGLRDDVIEKDYVLGWLLAAIASEPRLRTTWVFKGGLLAEKIRALLERCRPRDLYDVINVYRHPELIDDADSVLAVLRAKCAHAGSPVPDADAILGSPFRDELDQEWANMLAHQLPHLPAVTEYWKSVQAMFAWLGGAARPRLERVEASQQLDPNWTPPRSMASWAGGRPLDLIRFGGSNRLKVEIDYRAERGRHGWRRVEPYAFRRTLDGSVILFVLNDRGQLRSYRTDRIAGVRVTDESFEPSHLVEF